MAKLQRAKRSSAVRLSAGVPCNRNLSGALEMVDRSSRDERLNPLEVKLATLRRPLASQITATFCTPRRPGTR